MYKSLLILLILVSLNACTTGAEPKFSDHPAIGGFSGKNAPSATRTNDEYFNTILSEAADRSVNFAGHYIVFLYACGKGCITGGVIDAATGINVADFPDSYIAGDKPASFNLEYRQSSTLMVITGKSARRDTGIETHFYNFEDNAFRSLNHASSLN